MNRRHYRRKQKGYRDVLVELQHVSRRIEIENRRRVAAFNEKYRERLSLFGDEVYSLPVPLIDSIQKTIPDFLTQADEQFERDLTNATGAGLFLGSPLIHPALHERNPTPLEKEYRKRVDSLPAEIALRRKGTDRAPQGANATDADSDRIATLKQQVNQRQIAFTAWLVTNDEFRSDRSRFIYSWSRRIHELGGFPEVPFSLIGEGPRVPKSDRRFYAGYILFYRKWGIQSFASWELPIILQPELHSPSLMHLPSVSEAGLLMFVP